MQAHRHSDGFLARAHLGFGIVAFEFVKHPHPVDQRLIGTGGGVDQGQGLDCAVHHECEIALHRLQVAGDQCGAGCGFLFRFGHLRGGDGECHCGAFHIHCLQHLGVDLAECGQHLFRAQTDLPVATRMPPCFAIAEHLRFGGRTDGGQNRLGVGLGVKQINRARCAMHVLWPRAPDQQASDLHRLFARFATAEHGADLEQGQIGKTTRLIARCGLQQTRQKVGPHMAHFR